MQEIFISYRRDDTRDISWRVYDQLQKRFGTEAVFKDVDNIPLGTDFREHVDSALRQRTVMLIVNGNNWVGQNYETNQCRIDDPDDFVRIEVDTALQRKIRVIPLLVHGASMPSS